MTVTWTGDNEEEIREFQKSVEADWMFSVGGYRSPNTVFWRTVAWLLNRVPERFGYPEWCPPDDRSVLHLTWFEPVEPVAFPEELYEQTLEFWIMRPDGPITRDDAVNLLEHLRPGLTEWGGKAARSLMRHVRVLPGQAITADGEVIPGDADS